MDHFKEFCLFNYLEDTALPNKQLYGIWRDPSACLRDGSLSINQTQKMAIRMVHIFGSLKGLEEFKDYLNLI